MSTDTFHITVLPKKKNVVVLRVATGLAGQGRNDTMHTRSFALSVLAEARSRFNENAFGRAPAKGVRFRKAARSTALEIEIEKQRWPSTWSTSESFFEANVGKYIAKTRVRARKNRSRSDRVSREERARFEELEQSNLPLDEFEEAFCAHFHFIELEVHTTDARWLEGIEVGWIFGTAAYDVWCE